ncbi:MAG: hypothetical protein ACR2NR_16555 [Solirubrobacteraceae bacterium]
MLSGSRGVRGEIQLGWRGPNSGAGEPDQVQREFADDPQARRQALTQLYEGRALKPLAALWWILRGPVLMALAALASPRRQRLPDRLARIPVIRER